MSPSKHMRTISFLIIAILLLFVAAFFYLGDVNKKLPLTILSPYFDYSDTEINSLQKLRVSDALELQDVLEWEDKAFETVSQTKMDGVLAAKFYAYLWAAQRDFVYLTYKLHKKPVGNVSFLSREVICLFFAEQCSKFSVDSVDAFSQKASELVLVKIRQRIEIDQKNTRPYEIKQGETVWQGTGSYKGIDAGSWKTWLIKSAAEYRLPAPPDPASPEGQEQLEQIRRVYENLNDEQKKAIAYWAAGPGTKTAAGMWLKFASDAMSDTSLNLEKILYYRSLLALIIVDTEIAAMDSKYTYWVKRPFMVDNSILTFMPTPNHPSYPSDSIAVAGAGSAFLSYLFPDQKEKWNSMVMEAANSRVWSGIHFPMDVEQGLELGKKIVESVISKINKINQS